MTSPGRQILLDHVSEATWQAQVVRWAQRAGWRVYHTFDSRRSAAGFPDLVLCKPGRLVFAELKARHGGVRSEQAAWLALLATCPPAECYVWRPADEVLVRRTLGVAA